MTALSCHSRSCSSSGTIWGTGVGLAVLVDGDEDHDAVGRRAQVAVLGVAGRDGDEDVHARRARVDDPGGGLDEVADLDGPREAHVADVGRDAVGPAPAGCRRVARLVDPLEDAPSTHGAGVAGIGRRSEEAQGDLSGAARHGSSSKVVSATSVADLAASWLAQVRPAGGGRDEVGDRVSRPGAACRPSVMVAVNAVAGSSWATWIVVAQPSTHEVSAAGPADPLGVEPDAEHVAVCRRRRTEEDPKPSRATSGTRPRKAPFARASSRGDDEKPVACRRRAARPRRAAPRRGCRPRAPRRRRAGTGPGRSVEPR